MHKYLTRRDFLVRCMGAYSSATAGLLFPGRIINSGNRQSPHLAVVSGKTETAVKHAIDLLGGINKFVKPNDRVLLKPNVSFPNPEKWGTTTNPAVVRSVAQLALEAGAGRVFVADNTMREGMICFEKTGLSAALKEIDKIKIIPLSKENLFTELPVPNGKAIKTVKVAKLIQRCDVFINLPCAKSHTATEVSFGLKNLMGVIWDRSFFHSGTDIHTAIAELSTVVRPHLTLLDATRALVTGGPTGPGKVAALDTIIAGIDPVAVDSYAVTLAEWNKRMLRAGSVAHLSYASNLGIGEIDLKKLTVKKVSI
jgi:uncharacterized protein (DUF362 family)